MWLERSEKRQAITLSGALVRSHRRARRVTGSNKEVDHVKNSGSEIVCRHFTISLRNE